MYGNYLFKKTDIRPEIFVHIAIIAIVFLLLPLPSKWDHNEVVVMRTMCVIYVVLLIAFSYTHTIYMDDKKFSFVIWNRFLFHIDLKFENIKRISIDSRHKTKATGEWSTTRRAFAGNTILQVFSIKYSFAHSMWILGYMRQREIQIEMKGGRKFAINTSDFDSLLYEIKKIPELAAKIEPDYFDLGKWKD